MIRTLEGGGGLVLCIRRVVRFGPALARLGRCCRDWRGASLGRGRRVGVAWCSTSRVGYYHRTFCGQPSFATPFAVAEAPSIRRSIPLRTSTSTCSASLAKSENGGHSVTVPTTSGALVREGGIAFCRRETVRSKAQA